MDDLKWLPFTNYMHGQISSLSCECFAVNNIFNAPVVGNNCFIHVIGTYKSNNFSVFGIITLYATYVNIPSETAHRIK